MNLHTLPPGSAPKCPLMLILIINKKIRHKQQKNTPSLIVLQKFTNNKIGFINNKISQNNSKNHTTYLSQRSCII
jgi:hypothetical protein